MQKYQHIYNAAMNILAVEYLVKERNHNKFFDSVEILLSFDNTDMLCLNVDLSLNMHIANLGLMIIGGDYDKQKGILFSTLKKKREACEFIEGDKTVAEIVASMTEEQKKALYYIVGRSMEENERGIELD